MSTTKIEWATKVWNPVTGCTHVSDGCKNCYAERFAKRLKGMNLFTGKYKNGFVPTFYQNVLLEPITWKKSQRIFVCSMGDLFHENIPFEIIDSVFRVMSDIDRHTYMILTKRPQRILDFYTWKSNQTGILWLPKSNVWIGISAENQRTFLERFGILSKIPAAIRFISFEPLLSAINITPIFPNKIDWVIAGGETGYGSRPSDPEWFYQLRDQCILNKIPFFFKGWGDWADNHHIPYSALIKLDKAKRYTFGSGYFSHNVYRVGKINTIRNMDDKVWNQIPVIQ